MSVRFISLTPVRLFALASFGIYLSSCGGPELTNVPHIEGMQEFAETATGDTFDYNKLTLSNTTGQINTISPSVLPEKGKAFRGTDITLTSYVTLKVTDQAFPYDKAKWALSVGSKTSPKIYLATNGLKIEDTLPATGDVRAGIVKATLTFADGKLPEEFYADSVMEESGGRKKLQFRLFYSVKGEGPAAVSSKDGLSSAYLQNDKGAMKFAPTLGETTTRDGSFTMEVVAPSDTSAIEFGNENNATDVGKSNVTGYVVAYWKDSDCSSGWKFRTNKKLTRGAVETPLSCGFLQKSARDSAASQCQLGCQTTPVTDDTFGQTFDSIAVPDADVNAENPTANVGCYNVRYVPADGRSSFALDQLDNGSDYGVMVWGVDAAGGLSRARSRCSFVRPQPIKIASLEKTPGLKKTREDCFVVTAASGAIDSDSVHYWRILRDKYLDRVGFSSWYYKNGPSLAAWLNKHEKLKPAANFVFTWSAKSIVNFEILVHKSQNILLKIWQSLWEQQASAQAPKPAISSAESNPATDAPAEVLTPAFKDQPGNLYSPSSSDSQSAPFVAQPLGSASSSLYFLIEAHKPTSDTALWNKYYPMRTPVFFAIGQTFRIIDILGELGFGGEIHMMSSQGKEPQSSSVDANGNAMSAKKIGFFAPGFALVADYRLRIGSAPWFAPRIGISGGLDRFREEEAKSELEAKSSASSKTSDSVGTMGITDVKKVFALRGALEFSLTKLFSEDMGQTKYAYDLEDFALSLNAAYNFDYSKSLSFSGLRYGVGFAFLLL